MKKIILPALIIFFFTINNCSLADDVDNAFNALECARLFEEVDEKIDREDGNCSEIRADINRILNNCESFLDEEQKASLEFYAANCDVDS